MRILTELDDMVLPCPLSRVALEISQVVDDPQYEFFSPIIGQALITLAGSTKKKLLPFKLGQTGLL